MRKTILLLPALLFSYLCVFPQNVKKELVATRVKQAPKIDAVLTDTIWNGLPIATDFVQMELTPGAPSIQPTEVKLAYDNQAIYISAFMRDVSRDSIDMQFSKRDESLGENFGVLLDTYHDGINAFMFVVMPTGVQLDGKISSLGQDLNWNAVWESKVKILDNGWAVEMKIPFSAIRFSNEEEQIWGINFIRKIRRTREVAFWNFIDPAITNSGFVNQFGNLTGIKNIKAPFRLSVSPYVSAYAENYDGSSNYLLNGGMDLKYGINDAFTLDMTLIPDFGQVQSDNKVLNLSPYEVKYDERRQFFTEGTELFNKGNIFYSRRIGGIPMGYYDVEGELEEGETLKENPSTVQLINASKISGRTEKDLGIGFFNATSANTYAVIEDSLQQERRVLTQPLTNYNILVLDQALKNNSYISFINTNVMRKGSLYDANVSAALFSANSKNNKYTASGSAIISQKYNSGFNNPELGYASDWFIGKSGGNFQYNYTGSIETDTYDPNDLGLLFNNNSVEHFANVSYTIFKPFWKVNNFYAGTGIMYGRVYNPSAFWNFSLSGETWTTFSKHFFSTGAWFNIEPVTTYDYWEPRVAGRYYVYPINYFGGYWFSSDYRKTFALDGRMHYRWFDENNRTNLAFGFSPRLRASDKLMITHDFDRYYNRDDIGYVSSTDDTITFGKRNVLTYSNSLNASYIFTNRMSLTFRLRHYWSKAEYSNFYTLSSDGILQDTSYNKNHNINFNAFNVDMVYTWQFLPGSEMSLVWKNTILTEDTEVALNYWKNLNNTFTSSQTNSLSIKVLYYIDYLSLRRIG